MYTAQEGGWTNETVSLAYEPTVMVLSWTGTDRW